jgi:hypothetical protein
MCGLNGHHVCLNHEENCLLLHKIYDFEISDSNEDLTPKNK